MAQPWFSCTSQQDSQESLKPSARDQRESQKPDASLSRALEDPDRRALRRQRGARNLPPVGAGGVQRAAYRFCLIE